MDRGTLVSSRVARDVGEEFENTGNDTLPLRFVHECPGLPAEGVDLTLLDHSSQQRWSLGGA